MIFAHTNLVSTNSLSHEAIEGIHIRDGKINYPLLHYIGPHTPEHCHCQPPPTDSLDQLPPLDSDARLILLSRNRLLFYGSPAKSLSFLQAQGDLVKVIRLIDFQFLPKDIEECNKPGTCWKREREELIRFIGENLILSNLVLSLDAGPCFEWYIMTCMLEENSPWVLEAYKSIVEPIRQWGEKKLKGFYVFWACFHDHEGQAEREVMGEDYVAEGKIDSEEREPLGPHKDDWKTDTPMDLV